MSESIVSSMLTHTPANFSFPSPIFPTLNIGASPLPCHQKWNKKLWGSKLNTVAKVLLFAQVGNKVFYSPWVGNLNWWILCNSDEVFLAPWHTYFVKIKCLCVIPAAYLQQVRLKKIWHSSSNKGKFDLFFSLSQ